MAYVERDFVPPGTPCLGTFTRPVNNKVYVMYHGTSKQAANKIMREGFKPSTDGMLGKGVYLSRDFQKASRYPLHLPPSEKVVIKVAVDVGKVVKIDRQGHYMQKMWRHFGYDTAWCPPLCGMVQSGLEEDCVKNPKSIIRAQIM